MEDLFLSGGRIVKKEVSKMHEGYFNSDTYYCSKCDKPHHYGSKCGKEHIKFGSAASKKKMLLERGVF